MPRLIMIVPSRRYIPVADCYDYYTLEWLDGYSRQVDYAADRLDSNERGIQVGRRLERQRAMRLEVPVPAEQSLESVRAATIETFTQAAAWADGGTIAFVLDHGEPGVVPLAPNGALLLSTEALEKLAGALADGDDVSSNAPWAAAIAIGRPLAPQRGHRIVRRVDILSCSVAIGARGQRAIDALAQIWGVPVRGLRGEFSSFWSREGGYDGVVVQPGTEEPMYGLEFHDRFPDDPRLFYEARPRGRPMGHR